MRITGGRYKGLKISSKVGAGVRPTASRVREAIFSIIGQDLTGKSFLDAFGGSGLMGIEAYSRGASATIYEKNNAAFRNIVQTIKKGQMHITVERGCAGRALKKKWNIIFMDPPYALDPKPWLNMAQGKFTDALIYEHAAKAILPDKIGQSFRVKHKKYGDCALSIFHCDT